MQPNQQKNALAKDPDPKKNYQKDVESETESTELVNDQSQQQVTNDSEPEQGAPGISPDEEEEKDEKSNNLRDALNDDNLALPPDELDDSIVN